VKPTPEQIEIRTGVLPSPETPESVQVFAHLGGDSELWVHWPLSEPEPKFLVYVRGWMSLHQVAALHDEIENAVSAFPSIQPE
jgi:hypothetical protein